MYESYFEKITYLLSNTLNNFHNIAYSLAAFYFILADCIQAYLFSTEDLPRIGNKWLANQSLT